MPLAYRPGALHGDSAAVSALTALGSSENLFVRLQILRFGAAPILTMNKIRKEIAVPVRAEIVEAVRAMLRREPSVDAITFSGNGEPTLHPDFEVLVADIKNRTQ